MGVCVRYGEIRVRSWGLPFADLPWTSRPSGFCSATCGLAIDSGSPSSSSLGPPSFSVSPSTLDWGFGRAPLVRCRRLNWGFRRVSVRL
ncbi:hypothetical protein U1Q18_016705 [Sarracenia purpurea var. burkii]